MALIEVLNVERTYRLGSQTVSALKGVTLAIDKGEFTAISGPSGSGKTTLLNLLGCLEKPTAGSVLIDGRDTASFNRSQLARWRGEKLGFIFQRFNLLPVLTALENVEYPLMSRALPAPERARRAREALDQVGLGHHLRHKPMELSGGQQQRVAIARALVGDPAVILADEPTANLDHATGAGILDLLGRINTERGTTILFSTHDHRILEKARRVIPLLDGRPA